MQTSALPCGRIYKAF